MTDRGTIEFKYGKALSIFLSHRRKMMEKLGDRLKRLREKNKRSVKDVAQYLKVSPSTYREWEYGRVIKGEPYLDLSKLFNVSLNYLLTGTSSSIEDDLLEIEKAVKNIRLGL